MRLTFSTPILTGLALMWVLPVHADDSKSTESRLRDALKSAVQQLRSTQDQLATAQAAQAETDHELTVCKGELTQTTTDLKNLQEKSAADHAAAEDAIAKLNEQNAYLQRLVEDRERKNLDLYQTGLEVLNRYEKFSMGEALFAKEPFTGLTRVKLENLVQGYEDKLVQSKTFAGQPITPVPDVKTTSGASATPAVPSAPAAVPAAGKGPLTPPLPDHTGGEKVSWLSKYALDLQSAVRELLRKNSKTKLASGDVQLKLWVGSDGHITEVELVGTTGDPNLDVDVKNVLLLSDGVPVPPDGQEMPVIVALSTPQGS